MIKETLRIFSSARVADAEGRQVW